MHKNTGGVIFGSVAIFLYVAVSCGWKEKLVRVDRVLSFWLDFSWSAFWRGLTCYLWIAKGVILIQTFLIKLLDIFSINWALINVFMLDWRITLKIWGICPTLTHLSIRKLFYNLKEIKVRFIRIEKNIFSNNSS